MTQPTLFDPPVQMQVHQRERTRQSEVILLTNIDKLRGNCLKLVKFWQKNNFWLTDDDARQLLEVRNLSQRVANIRHINKIPVESEPVPSKRCVRHRLLCTCRHVHGQAVGGCCYLHSQELKVG